ncbi:hypothetical protein AVEN_249470-1 [Araneus ventricosus]|uniref:Uncharacterized protein n=1 Tax=Araneus ventricosus TaxID=182803 RepID=A0A4Y2T0N6_ARAVE|nr:hypothetical protein AVEN_249470-1 [Araneus ventricosus]
MRKDAEVSVSDMIRQEFIPRYSVRNGLLDLNTYGLFLGPCPELSLQTHDHQVDLPGEKGTFSPLISSTPDQQHTNHLVPPSSNLPNSSSSTPRKDQDTLNIQFT